MQPFELERRVYSLLRDCEDNLGISRDTIHFIQRDGIQNYSLRVYANTQVSSFLYNNLHLYQSLMGPSEAHKTNILKLFKYSCRSSLDLTLMNGEPIKVKLNYYENSMGHFDSTLKAPHKVERLLESLLALNYPIPNKVLDEMKLLSMFSNRLTKDALQTLINHLTEARMEELIKLEQIMQKNFESEFEKLKNNIDQIILENS